MNNDLVKPNTESMGLNIILGKIQKIIEFVKPLQSHNAASQVNDWCTKIHSEIRNYQRGIKHEIDKKHLQGCLDQCHHWLTTLVYGLTDDDKKKETQENVKEIVKLKLRLNRYLK